MSENDLILIVEVFADPLWETKAISIIEILGGAYLPFDENELWVLRESIDQVPPIKSGRWHKLTLKRIWEHTPLNEPSADYYTCLNVELSPHSCLQCGQQLGKKESEEIDQYGAEPFCSQYCAEKWAGTPMPVSQGALVFDKIMNGNK